MPELEEDIKKNLKHRGGRNTTNDESIAETKFHEDEELGKNPISNTATRKSPIITKELEKSTQWFSGKKKKKTRKW